MSAYYDDPNMWEHRASSIRELASAVRDEEARGLLQKIASLYDRLAANAERRVREEITENDRLSAYGGALQVPGSGSARNVRVDAKSVRAKHNGRDRRNI